VKNVHYSIENHNMYLPCIYIRHNRHFSPFSPNTGEENHDSHSVRQFISDAIAIGWLKPYDILVCDNAAIHEAGCNHNLGDYLWNTAGLDNLPLKILLLPLPTRSPELNPIELLWNTLRQRLRGYRRGLDGSHGVARAACAIMNGFEFELVERTFRHCGYKNF
jgi:hypothetical protein